MNCNVVEHIAQKTSCNFPSVKHEGELAKMVASSRIPSPDRRYDFDYILSFKWNVCDDCGQQLTKGTIIEYGAVKLCADCIRKSYNNLQKRAGGSRSYNIRK